MEKSVYSIIPDPKTLLALEPEELGGIVLEYLNGLPENSGQLNRGNFTLPHTVSQYPPEHHDEILRALTEGWMWLEREGMLAPRPGGGGFVNITRRGRTMKSATDLQAYRRASLLPRQLLHPMLVGKVIAPFIRGDYDVAVFQAFKEVEVAVRTKGKFQASDIGVALMRKAFDPKSGPLTDMTDPEREATAHLFAGAIGHAKNPHSHRHAAIADPGEAVELLMLASYLLRVVDTR